MLLASIMTPYVPVAQLDRVSGFEPDGRGFDSLRARVLGMNKIINIQIIK